jgi:hypothetical protein
VIVLCAASSYAEPSDATPVGKVIASIIRENRTTLVLETRVPLVSGAGVYVGDGIRAIIDDKLSHSMIPAASGAAEGLDEKPSLSIPNTSAENPVYYYGATVAGKQDIPKDAPVRTAALIAPSYLQVKLEEHYTFESKKDATVTARQGDRVMINKGSLNEVADRDIYKIYGSSGQYKGLVEMRGVGDFQSSGVLYNRLEDLHREALDTEVGDRLVFAGQRKLFALGIMGGLMADPEQVLGNTEKTLTGGLLWSLTFTDGWGAEILFGGAYRSINAASPLGGAEFVQEKHQATYIAPMWFKKNLFYPSNISPFVAAGLSVLNAEHVYSHQTAIYNPNDSETKNLTTIVPVFGAGIELFPGRFFSPRVEVRYYDGPNLPAAGQDFKTSALFYSAGFLTTW